VGGLIPRLRQVCSRDFLGTSGSGMEADGARTRRWKAPPDLDRLLHSAKREVIAQADDDLGAMNHVVFTGRIVADPQRDKSREGDPVTVLLVSFIAPDGTGCCEVEVPDELAEPHRRNLCTGVAVLVSGAMTGAGGVWATTISVGEARR
jgi:hypothetical protein